ITQDQDEPLPPFIITYHSAAVQSRLPFADLPDEMNLYKEELNPLYETAVVDLDGIQIKGSAISYAVACSNNTTKKRESQVFIIENFQRKDFLQEGFLRRKSAYLGRYPLA
ncbi:MAG: hypothetical protein FWE85_05260, partial [Clostridiales bacterium]|nr:hypothetical protein [Clostridiales bacterium]